MLELWLNKVEEDREVKKYISIVKMSSGIDTKKILVKNLDVEHIRKVEDIVKDLKFQINIYLKKKFYESNFLKF